MVGVTTGIDCNGNSSAIKGEDSEEFELWTFETGKVAYAMSIGSIGHVNLWNNGVWLLNSRLSQMLLTVIYSLQAPTLGTSIGGTKSIQSISYKLEK